MPLIKDYTDRIFNSNIPGSYPIRFILHNAGNNKLQLLKIVKSVTGWDLREAKEIVIDETQKNSIMFRMNMLPEQLKDFRDKVTACDGVEFELDGRDRLRNRKLIELGIGDKSDVIEEIVDINIKELFTNGIDTMKIEKLLKRVYSNIDEIKIKEIYESYLQKSDN